ncbi:MAG: hypothetical protein DRP00_01960 [Candidatus Aenigmatarchaeota archaeon]|nr:MAG: hypothetical protein DRP00_01960 [Candidatus Aenigmarchaeota archaeon]
MAYLIGVSSGIFGAVPEAEKIQYAGLAKKAEYCITKGVQFVQIDLESVSEFKAPNLKEDMEKIRKLGVRYGIHSETRAFGVEVAELDSAIETDYKFGHERLREILEKSGEIKSEYVLIHSSESHPFLLLERHLQPAALVDFFGNPLREFLEENKDLLDWALGGGVEDISECVYDVWLKKKKGISVEDIKGAFKASGLNPQDFIWIEVIGRPLAEILRGRILDRVETWEIETGKDYESLEPDKKKIVNEQIKRSLNVLVSDIRTALLNYVQSRTLHYGPERIAYYFIAKWMERTNDPLWNNIVNATIEFFARSEKKSVEEWLREKGIKEKSIDDENFRKYSYLWVPAVSAKYIWGHLNQDKNPKKTYYDLKKIIKKYNMPLVLETPMAHRGIEEWLRLPNPIQMYYLAKQVNEEAGFFCLAVAMDFEHMLSIRLDPEVVIDCLPEEAGKFVIVLHVGYPSPLAPAHIPIPLGSEQQLYLYKLMYKLRKKGFGKDEKDYYIIFERGGGPDPIKQSIIALRKIVEFLEKDVPPEKLPMEFYGFATGEIASLERQRAIIFEHALDPLKGLVYVPEEEHTFLGRAATERVAPEKWKKEELR